MGSTALFAAVLASAADAPAATFVVDSTIDAIDASPGNATCATSLGKCTLRAAVQEANALAGADTILLSVGLYKLTLQGVGEDGASTGDLDVTDNTSISGAGLGNTIIDGGNFDRVFHVIGAQSLSLQALTIRRGKAPLGQGGGVYTAAAGSALLLYGVTIEKCSADDGAGVYATGYVEGAHVLFQRNMATGTGGGLYGKDYTDLYDALFEKNKSVGDAGGIYQEGQYVELDSSIFRGNTAASGGAVYIGTTTGPSFFSTCAFQKNLASVNGGAIRNHGSLTLVQAILEANRADSGAGLFNGAGGSVDVKGVTFSKNVAKTSGGGLANHDTATLQRVTFFDNVAPAGGGGAIYRPSGVSTTAVNTIIKGKDTCDGGITSLGTNIETANLCGLAMAGDLPNTDPQLSKIATFSDQLYWGIPLTRFHVPLPGSPAIDGGNNTYVQYEQRYGSATVDGDGNGSVVVDIGAIEAGLEMY